MVSNVPRYGGPMTRTEGPTRPLIAGALIAYSAVVVALTTLKSFFTIGLLWKPENQRVRSLELIPFDNFFTSATWFGPVFNTVGNIALFVPFGMMAVMLWRGARRPVLRTALVGLLFSLVIEAVQFIFSLGRTDVDDLLLNTLGAALGAWLALLGGRRWRSFLVGLTLLAVVVFVVLVILGPSLGDPSQITPVG